MAAVKSVAIIGAGPAGLVTAKYMLAAGLRPTIFDKRPHVGGLWAPPLSGAVNLKPAMKTNASNFVTSFSDLPWDRSGKSNYPTVVEVGAYLEDYRKAYIPHDCLKLGCEIVGVSRADEAASWHVKWQAREGAAQEDFEFLVVASGFFAQAHTPDVGDLGGTVHSSEYSFSKVYSADAAKKQKIVIVGGSLSSAEEAGDVALRVASLPEEQQKNVEIIHVFTRPLYAIPKQLPLPSPQDEKAPRFLPADLVFYDTSRFENPPPVDISPEDFYRGLNTFVRSALGGKADAHVVAEELRMWDEDMCQPPIPTLSDVYTGHVRTGRIKPMIGRVSKIENRTLFIENSRRGTPPSELSDVTAVVFCTGYKTTLGRFLPESLLPAPDEKISYPIKSTRVLPLQLYKNTLSPRLGRNAGMVGFFTRPGPFWGSLELQARWLAGLFSDTLLWPTENEIKSEADRLAQAQETGGSVKLTKERGDYLEWILDLGKQCGVSPFAESHASGLPVKTYIPAHLPPISLSAKPMIEALNATVVATAGRSRYITDAIFRALHGSWSVDRVFISNPAFMPSGHFVGTCNFSPRLQTFSFDSTTYEVLPELDPAQNETPGGEISEYLYSEEGIFMSENGTSMSATMRYIYRWDPHTGRISTWYVKPGETTVSHFFHDVELLDSGAPGVLQGKGWKAKGSRHLCGDDWYEPRYRFAFEGAELEEIEISYGAKGPKKDYRATSTLVRGTKETKPGVWGL